MTDKKTIFIVEDNTIYSKQLAKFLLNNVGDKFEILTFPVSEWMEVKLDLGEIPEFIIIDNYLNNIFDNAGQGKNVILKYHRIFPNIKFILHSSFEVETTEDLKVIKKGPNSQEELLKYINMS